ncbi:MAG: hypothetical protein K0U93_30370 [Gammaproteobacteria bacterium]|nr:hypothetical protein [Gammaproteobacteria bacterium]
MSIATGPLVAAPLDLDTTFANAGVQTVDFALQGIDAHDEVRDVVIAPDAKVVAVGQAQNGGTPSIALTRLNADGTPDLTFGGTGTVVYQSLAHASGAGVALQSDGSILVAGTVHGSGPHSAIDVVVLRYDAAGVLDTSFGNAGVFRWHGPEREEAQAIALRGDGRVIVLAGQDIYDPNDPYRSDFLVLQLDKNGQLDPSFASGGIRTLHFGNNWNRPTDLAVHNDGRVVVTGVSVQATNILNDYGYGVLARLLPNGALDTSLTGGNALWCQLFQSCGWVLTSFGGGGRDFPEALAVKRENGFEDGKVIVAGDFGIARHNEDGSLDSSFGTNGVNDLANHTGAGVALRVDGRITLAGSRDGDFALSLFSTMGHLEQTCSGPASVTTDIAASLDRARAIAIAPQGQIVVAGRALVADNDFAFARYRGGPCKSALLRASRAFVAYNIFVHPQDKVGPNWPGRLARLALGEQPHGLLAPARVHAGRGTLDDMPSAYMAYDLREDTHGWNGPKMIVNSPLGQAHVRPGRGDFVFAPAALDYGEGAVPPAERSSGYACYLIEELRPYALAALKVTDVLGNTVEASIDTATHLCIAIDVAPRSGEVSALVCARTKHSHATRQTVLASSGSMHYEATMSAFDGLCVNATVDTE